MSIKRISISNLFHLFIESNFMFTIDSVKGFFQRAFYERECICIECCVFVDVQMGAGDWNYCPLNFYFNSIIIISNITEHSRVLRIKLWSRANWFDDAYRFHLIIDINNFQVNRISHQFIPCIETLWQNDRSTITGK